VTKNFSLFLYQNCVRRGQWATYFSEYNCDLKFCEHLTGTSNGKKLRRNDEENNDYTIKIYGISCGKCVSCLKAMCDVYFRMLIFCVQCILHKQHILPTNALVGNICCLFVVCKATCDVYFLILIFCVLCILHKQHSYITNKCICW
jgi:hypothetical protein